MFDQLKDQLLALGPESVTLRRAFRLQAATRGISMRVQGDQIRLSRGRRTVLLAVRNQISVPFLVRHWGMFFRTVVPQTLDGRQVLDFSVPGLHRYAASGLCFYCPGIAEDDCMDAYTASYRPQPGDVVWDVGAHAGMSSYFFARMVGPTGTVYAFEPDDTSYNCLLRNIETHRLSNTVPLKFALSDSSGTATFQMNGSMGAGLSEFLPNATEGEYRTVQTLSIEDACSRFGVPRYIKLDIEGAEVHALAGSVRFLAAHRIDLSIESNHKVGGAFTASRLEALFAGIGYRAWSSDRFGQLFTWAEPTASC
jgi:FkbM family methyltransferase